MACGNCVPYEKYRTVVDENEQLKTRMARIGTLANAMAEQARVEEREQKELEMILAVLEGRG